MLAVLLVVERNRINLCGAFRMMNCVFQRCWIICGFSRLQIIAFLGTMISLVGVHGGHLKTPSFNNYPLGA